MNNLRLLYCLALLLLLEGCASKGPRTTCVAIDEEQVLNSYLKGDNLRATINRMARSLVASRALNTEDGSQPKITFTGIEDKTIRGVDTYNLQSCIRKNLTIANIVFLDGSSDVVHQGVHDVARGTPDQFADSDYILEGALFETGRSELTNLNWRKKL